MCVQNVKKLDTERTGAVHNGGFDRVNKKCILGNFSRNLFYNFWTQIGTVFRIFDDISVFQINKLGMYLMEQIQNKNFVMQNFNQITNEILDRTLGVVGKTVDDGKIKFTNWHFSFNPNIIPQPKFFKSIAKSDTNLTKIIRQFNNIRPKVISGESNSSGLNVVIGYGCGGGGEASLVLNGGKIKLYTFQTWDYVKYLCGIARSIWFKLDKCDRITIWSLLYGFSDHVKPFEGTIKKITKSKEFIRDEVNKGRMLKVKNACFEKILCAKYFDIIEDKIDSNNIKYQKVRRVADCTLTNDHLLPVATNLKYDFNTAESLFKNVELFKILLATTVATVSDKTDFYRFIPIMVSEFSYIWDGADLYADLYSKMGHRYSSCFANMVAVLMDKIFNINNPQIRAVSLQDDTIFLQKSPIQFDIVRKHNELQNFQLNDKKTQLNTTMPTWSGYEFCLKSQKLRLPTVKSEKMLEMIKSFRKIKITRRFLARLIGKLYSARLICFGIGINLSVMLMRTRSYMFLNSKLFYDELNELKAKWFFKEEIIKKYSSFFDEELPSLNEDEMNKIEIELMVTWEIISSRVKFLDIRKNIFSLNDYIITEQVDKSF